uniref:Uncharacterized protein n=1 Tax=Nelumbo nucifera TaxID=4432 RepID=A0A822YJP2_NELNU|nr:TPA_asm: hypothetical protein HUJ06_010380 [Nelumbo nucifera]
MGSSESKEDVSGGAGNQTDTNAEERKTNNTTHAALAVAVGAAVGTALVGWGLSQTATGSESKQEDEDDHHHLTQKMMKQPGRDGYMPRANFEENPRNYFRELRGKMND